MGLVTSYETFSSSKVSSYDDDFAFRMTQHAEMSKEKRHGVTRSVLAARLKSYLQDRDIKQIDIANHLGLGKSGISKKLSGQESISTFFLEALARYRAVDPVVLIASDDVRDLLELWTAADAATRRFVLGALRGNTESPEAPEPPQSARRQQTRPFRPR